MIKQAVMHLINLVIAINLHPFVKFSIVGGTTAVIYFLVMVAVDYSIGLNYIISVSIAFFVSTAFHYLMNMCFTFRAVAKPLGRQVFRYIVMLLMNYLITIVVVNFCVERLCLSAYTGVWVSLIFTTSIGYFFARDWVFNTLRR